MHEINEDPLVHREVPFSSHALYILQDKQVMHRICVFVRFQAQKEGM